MIEKYNFTFPLFPWNLFKWYIGFAVNIIVILVYVVVFGLDTMARYQEGAVTITRKTTTNSNLEPPGDIDHIDWFINFYSINT